MRLTGSRVQDIVPAVVLAAGGAAGVVATDGLRDLDRPVDVVGVCLAGFAGLALGFRRRSPLGVLGVTTVLIWSYLALGYPYGPLLLSFLVAVYTVARHLPPARSAPASLAALVLLLTHVFLNRAAPPGLLGLIPGSAWAIVGYAIGALVRLNREAIERQRAESERRRVTDERLRIAQEVHDVVGHGLVAIKMQAEVALHLLAMKPEQAEVALTAISRTSTEALDEVRATLSVVREGPTPSLGRLSELCDRVAVAGMRVNVDASPLPHDVPAAVDLAGYRIVQESLTNALRHGEGGVADVRVDYQTDAVLITISNPMSRTPNERNGNAARTGRVGGLGVHGMRERVTALGGKFVAGPAGDGRFEVRACLPLGGDQ